MTKVLVVSDSCSLILSAKANLLDVLCEEFKVEIPKKVFDEVIVEGKKLGKVDAFIVEKKVNSKKVIVKGVVKERMKEFEQFNLDEGEKEAILLSIQEKADLLLVDDRQAINTAKLLGIKWVSLPVLLQWMYERNKILRDDALSALAILQREGRYKLDFILGVLKEIEGGIR